MAISLSPASLTFASTTRGTSSAAQTVTLTPDSTLDSVHGVSVTGTNAASFTVTETFDAYSGVQSKNASSIITGSPTFTVTFAPVAGSAVGSQTANINVHHNGPGKAYTTTIVATGTAA